MRKHSTYIFMLALTFAACRTGFADEGRSHVSTTMTQRYIGVKGDVEKFRALNWATDGFLTGLESINFDHEADSWGMNFEGHTLPGENDNEAVLHFEKDDVGKVSLDYNSFRKYFESNGAVYNRFADLSGYRGVDKEYYVDMEHFNLEVSPAVENFSGFSFYFNRHLKQGTKSRLALTIAREGATSKNIGPSYQDIDEVTNTFGVKAGKEIGGVDVTAEQSFEQYHAVSFREEKNISTTSTASDTKIRRQFQEPDSKLLTTTLNGKKWFWENTGFMQTGYRFAHLTAEENETLAEFDVNGTPRSFSSPKNKPDANAENDYDAHIFTGLFKVQPATHWDLLTKLKAEYGARDSSSLYPDDPDDPPNGIPNTFESNTAENKITRLGEGFSLRYNGIARTSLYAETEFEQTRNWLTEELRAVSGSAVASASNDFSRETLTNISKSVYTLGARVVPSRYFDLTNQIRHRIESNDYDDIAESAQGSSTARSAFFDGLKVNSNEAGSRITWKPWTWLRPSFRYRYQGNEYAARAEGMGSAKSQMTIHNFTYDVVWQPISKILLDFAYSQENAKTTTPAAGASSTNIPGFNADSHTWLSSMSYSPTDTLSLFGTYAYTLTRNFTDVTSISLIPFGSDFDKYDVTTGLNWSPTKKVTISPQYSYYSYEANPLVEIGDYSAHEGLIKVSIDWF